VSVDQAAIQIELPAEQSAAKKTGRESPWPWLALLFALQLGSPYLPLPNATVAGIAFIATTALYVIGVVQFIVQATRWNLKPLILLAGTIGFLWLWWALDNYGFAAAARPIAEAMKAQQQPDASQVFVLQFVRVLTDAALLGAAVLGGGLVAKLIKAPNMLGPICGVIAMVDIWGVLFAGPVSQMIEKAPEVAEKMMPSLPKAGQLAQGAQYAIQPVSIGVGDYLFLALLFAALHLNAMNWRGARNLAIPFIFVILMFVAFTGLHMPGLLPIGLAVALPNWRYFQFSREEKFALLWAGLLVVILSAVAYVAVQRALPEKEKKAPSSNLLPKGHPRREGNSPPLRGRPGGG
jgi:hypothetical protein